MTAAAPRTCRDASPSGSRRARSRSPAFPGGPVVDPSAPTQHRDVLGDEQRYALALRVDQFGDTGIDGPRRDRLHEFDDVVLGQTLERDRRGHPLRAELAHQPSQAVSGRDRLAAPGEQNEQRPATQTAGEIGDRVVRRLVRALEVVHEDDPRRLAGAGGDQHRRDGLEQPGGGSGALEGGRLRDVVAEVGKLGSEVRRIRQSRYRDGLRPPMARGSLGGRVQQLDDRPVGDPSLVVVAARLEDRGALAACAPEELRGEARLPDPGLALEQGDFEAHRHDDNGARAVP